MQLSNVTEEPKEVSGLHLVFSALDQKERRGISVLKYEGKCLFFSSILHLFDYATENDIKYFHTSAFEYEGIKDLLIKINEFLA